MGEKERFLNPLVAERRRTEIERFPIMCQRHILHDVSNFNNFHCSVLLGRFAMPDVGASLRLRDLLCGF